MSCQKVPYDSKAAALRDIKQIKANHIWRGKQIGNCAKAGRKLRVYECRFCDKWHLTTQKKHKK